MGRFKDQIKLSVIRQSKITKGSVLAGLEVKGLIALHFMRK